MGEYSCCDLSIWEIYYVFKLWLDDILLSWLLAFLAAILLSWDISEISQDGWLVLLVVDRPMIYFLFSLLSTILNHDNILPSLSLNLRVACLFFCKNSVLVFLVGLLSVNYPGEDLLWEAVLNGAMGWSSWIFLLSCSAGHNNASGLSHPKCDTLVHSW